MNDTEAADSQDQGEYLTPIPRKPGESLTMSFPEAIKQIINGKKVRRLDWASDEDHGLMKDGWLTIFTKGAFHSWLVNDGDMEAEDWVVVKESN